MAELFKYELSDDKEGVSSHPVFSNQIHKVSARAGRFLGAGDYFVTASLNKSMAAVSTETGKVLQRFKGAHEAAINRLCVFNESLVASGDDVGCIRVWDTRQPSTAGHTHEFTQHSDFISDMTVRYMQREGLDAKELLLAVSGDGTMTVNDLRRNRVMHQTETDNDDEYLSVRVMKHGKKVVVGTQSGVLNLFSWGAWNDCSDRFVGHPASVDSLVRLDEDTVISGSEDGIIRALNILPNKMIGVVGEHEDYPIERLALSHDMRVLASASHDETVRLWDFRPFVEDEEEEGEAEGEERDQGEDGVAAGRSEGESEEEERRESEGEEASSSSSEEDSDSSSEDDRKKGSAGAGPSAKAKIPPHVLKKILQGERARAARKEAGEEGEEEKEEKGGGSQKPKKGPAADSDSDGDGSDDSDGESDSDGPQKKKKERKRKRKGEGKVLSRKEIKTGGRGPGGLGGSGSFFADLL